MTVLITLTTAGTDTGPFDLYSNVDGYVSAFETGVSKAALLAGYSSALVPNGTTTIRIKSTGVCVNYIDVTVVTTTTTTTTGTPITTTTTTTTASVGQLFIYAKYIDSSDELGYTLNGGPYLGIGTVPTTNCDYIDVINGCNNGDVFVFQTLTNRAISGDTSSPCPASASSCTYTYTFTGTGANFVYITIDGSIAC